MSHVGRLLGPALLLVLTLASSGCGGADPAGPMAISYETEVNGIQAGYVRITPTPTGLLLDNQTERPIYSTALNAELLASWALDYCTGGANCAPIAQGQRREIPWASVHGYAADTKLFTVVWWNAVGQADGTARAGNIHNININR